MIGVDFSVSCVLLQVGVTRQKQTSMNPIKKTFVVHAAVLVMSVSKE